MDETTPVAVTMTAGQWQSVIDGLTYASELAERTEDPEVTDTDHAAWGTGILTIHDAMAEVKQ